jgi:hypothetical protein
MISAEVTSILRLSCCVPEIRSTELATNVISKNNIIRQCTFIISDEMTSFGAAIFETFYFFYLYLERSVENENKKPVCLCLSGGVLNMHSVSIRITTISAMYLLGLQCAWIAC